MNLDNVNSHKVFNELWVRPLYESDGDKIKISCIGRFIPVDIKGRYRFSTGTGFFSVDLSDTALSMDLNDYLQRYPHLAQVMIRAKDGSFMFKVVFFSRRSVDMADIEVGIDDHIENTVKKYESSITHDKLANELQKKCEITDGRNKWFLIRTGSVAEEDYQNDDSNADNEEKLTAFSICGEGVIIPVEKRRLDSDTEIFFASKIVYKNYRNDKSSIILVSGNLIFSDMAKRIQALAYNAMRILEEQEGSYLKAWDKYGDEEGKALLEKAKAVGEIFYTNVERDRDRKVILTIDGNIPKAFSEDDELELVKHDEIPPYLADKNMEWEEYRNVLEDKYKKDREKEKEDKKNSNQEESDEDDSIKSDTRDNKKRSCKIAEIKDRSITLEYDDTEFPEGMVLVLSTIGDVVQIERQIKARLAIKEGRSANPQLGLIIEEGAELPDTMRFTKLKPITPFVENKIFGKNKPTDRQKEAIEIALNTPDIAIIQGPPGTGKTTVIAAILERLNEEYDKKNSIRGRILVSGFQHDAVENIISRLSVNSLPAIKFGRRPGENEEDETITQKKLEQWTKDIITKLQEKSPQLQPIKEQQEIQIQFRQYIESPSGSAMEKILDNIISLPGSYISNDIASRAKKLRGSFEKETVQNYDLILIRALRTTENDFADDGARNAMMVYLSLGERLQPKEVELLKKAGDWKHGEATDFLKELEKLKIFLLDRFTPRPFYNIEKPKKEMLNLIAEVNEALSKQRGRGSKKDGILAGFLNELETNIQGIRSAIEDYNFVYAATTQGAEGKEIRRVKTKNPDDYVTYDTVIVDEAARVSPRDLLIPMAQAEKRIILVGDHRQLPHIIDENIIRKAMETKDKQDGTQKDNEKDEPLSVQFKHYIKHSMFEYMKNRLEKLFAKDEIKRTCTLNEQYRTHPLLGNFVNQYFYEKHNKEERFDSPLDESFFKQNLPGLDGRPALWINVPAAMGCEERSGTSWRRREEAKIIVSRLKEWLDCEAGKNMTFGVISFYRAQSNVIMEEAGKLDITERSTDGSWEIKEEYRFLSKEVEGKKTVEERLRIGTVDSFQGMEFDVVFLSMVRSPKVIPRREGGDDYERVKTNTFGHLVSDNRLCVSMSRQKKVLVVTGDAALALSEIGRDAVPALAGFCELCKKDGKFYES